MNNREECGKENGRDIFIDTNQEFVWR